MTIPSRIAGLENDEYVRKTDGYLPTAEVAFIDEIFKANSAILNALLTLLNERLFDNGNERYAVPLLCLVRSNPTRRQLALSHNTNALRTGLRPSLCAGRVLRMTARTSFSGLCRTASLRPAQTYHWLISSMHLPCLSLSPCADQALHMAPHRSADVLADRHTRVGGSVERAARERGAGRPVRSLPHPPPGRAGAAQYLPQRPCPPRSALRSALPIVMIGTSVAGCRCIKPCACLCPRYFCGVKPCLLVENHRPQAHAHPD